MSFRNILVIFILLSSFSLSANQQVPGICASKVGSKVVSGPSISRICEDIVLMPAGYHEAYVYFQFSNGAIEKTRMRFVGKETPTGGPNRESLYPLQLTAMDGVNASLASEKVQYLQAGANQVVEMSGTTPSGIPFIAREFPPRQW
jgi:hypothetical protein